MGQRTNDARQPPGRGNRRTHAGAGRHNLRTAELRSPMAATRVCLGCDRPFRSRGPWNRFCGRCHPAEDDEPEQCAHRYHVPREWPASIVNDADKL